MCAVWDHSPRPHSLSRDSSLVSRVVSTVRESRVLLLATAVSTAADSTDDLAAHLRGSAGVCCQRAHVYLFGSNVILMVMHMADLTITYMSWWRNISYIPR